LKIEQKVLKKVFIKKITLDDLLKIKRWYLSHPIKNVSGEKFNKSMRFFASLKMTNKTAPDACYSTFNYHLKRRKSPKDLLFKFYKNC